MGLGHRGCFTFLTHPHPHRPCDKTFPHQSAAVVSSMESTTKAPPSPLFPVSAYSLPTELWTKIFRYILQPDLHTRNHSNLIPLLTICRALKALLCSMPEYQLLCNAILRMRHSIFAAQQQLTVVKRRRFGFSGKFYLAALPSDSADSSQFTIKSVLDATKRAELRRIRDRAERCLPDAARKSCEECGSSHPTDDEQLMATCEDFVQSHSDEARPGIMEPHLRRLNTLKAMEARIDSNLHILQTLPPVPRPQTTVLNSRVGHCSCNGTHDIVEPVRSSWIGKDCIWKGSAEYIPNMVTLPLYSHVRVHFYTNDMPQQKHVR